MVGENDGVSFRLVVFEFVEMRGLGNVGAGLGRHRGAEFGRFEIRCDDFDAVDPVLDMAAVDDDSGAMPLAYGRCGQVLRRLIEIKCAGAVAGVEFGVGDIRVVNQLEFQSERLGDFGIDAADERVGAHAEDQIFDSAISSPGDFPFELTFEVPVVFRRGNVDARRRGNGVDGAIFQVPGVFGELGFALCAPSQGFPRAGLSGKG